MRGHQTILRGFMLHLGVAGDGVLHGLAAGRERAGECAPIVHLALPIPADALLAVRVARRKLRTELGTHSGRVQIPHVHRHAVRHLGLAGECKDQDEARERINEDALDITIRGERVNGDWEADEFTILLSTGGPAVRIKGELGNHNEPSSATLEVQDWLKAWTPYTPIAVSEDVLLSYCRCFNFE